MTGSKAREQQVGGAHYKDKKAQQYMVKLLEVLEVLG